VTTTTRRSFGSTAASTTTANDDGDGGDDPATTGRRHWRNWFDPVECVNPWDDPSLRLPPSLAAEDEGASFLAVVAHSRCLHVAQLLQQLHLAGRPVGEDRVTTERCNYALLQLLQAVLSSSATKKKNNSNDDATAAQQRMGKGQQRQRDGNGNDAKNDASAAASAAASAIAHTADAVLRAMQLFDRPEYTNNSDTTATRLPFLLPRPNRNTYKNVLRILAETKPTTDKGIPRRTREIVETMQRRYEMDGVLELKPHEFHWNCVLKAWQNYEPAADSDDDDIKSVEAAKVFLDDAFARDPSSYVVMMQICAHGHSTTKSAVLGANVAVKVWQDTIERYTDNDDNDHDGGGGGENSDETAVIHSLKTHFYAFFLQAIRYLPFHDKLRDRYYEACLDRCISMGKVNAIVLNEFLVHNASPELFRKFLGQYGERIRGMPPTQASQLLYDELIPYDWRANADQVRRKRK